MMKLGYTWAKGQGKQENTISHAVVSQFANLRVLSFARAMIGIDSDMENNSADPRTHMKLCRLIDASKGSG